MLVFTEKKVLSQHLSSIIEANKSIGFVPTMGALHQGHLSLMEQALKENDTVVVSIFVNPTQFNNIEDLEKYPRTLEADVNKMQTLSEKLLVYAPDVKDIYEEKLASESFDYDGLELKMEGKHRLGHFDGVGTIVKRLFEIITPNRAYFGEKDFQQLQIVKKLVEKFQLPVQIIGCPIFREPNGLAMSSRNERLSPEARKKAAFIYETLQKAKQNFITKQPDFKLEPFEIADEKTLSLCQKKDNNKKYRGFIAVFIENIRLIDNIPMY